MRTRSLAGTAATLAVAAGAFLSPALAGDPPRAALGGDARLEGGADLGAGGILPLMPPDGDEEEGREAIERGLMWLARHQDPEGFWSTRTFDDQCAGKACEGEGEKGNNVGVTATAVLAFLGASYDPKNHDEFTDPHTDRTVKFGECAKRGLSWLMKRQDQAGCMASRTNAKMMYDQALATLALCEAYAATKLEKYRRPAQDAANFIAEAQNPGKGWRYTPKCGDNDTSVTGWCFFALQSADRAGLDVPRRCFDGALSWVHEVTDDVYGRVGYTAKGTGKVIVLGRNENWEHHETLSAIGMLVRMGADRAGEKAMTDLGAKLLVCDLPTNMKWKIDAYYWHFGTAALAKFDGPDGKYWRSWRRQVRKVLHETQAADEDACVDGSWDPAPDRWAFEGGRAWVTAIQVMTLQSAYGYEAALHGRGKKKKK